MTAENQTENAVESTEATTPAAPAKRSNAKLFVALGAVVAIVAGGAVLSSVVEGKAEEKVADFVTKMESEANGDVKITYGDVGASLTGDSVTVKDLAFSEPDGKAVFEIGSTSVGAKGYVEGEQFPSAVDIDIQGFQVVDAKALEQLKSEMGVDYKDRNADLAFGYEYKDKADTFSSHAELAVEGLNEVSLSVELSNVKGVWDILQANYKANKGTLDLGHAERQTLNQAAPNIKLHNAKLSYVNDGELDNFLDKVAAEKRVSVDQLKAQFPVAIDTYISDPEIAKELKEFVASPKSISLSISPEKALSFQEIAGQGMAVMMGQSGQVIETLNIKIEAN